jgi:metal-responsive CopG/Arc/MetJ family transcriptional regulator
MLMASLTIRIDEDLLEKIDEQRGEDNRSEYVRKLIVSSLSNIEEHQKEEGLTQKYAVLQEDYNRLKTELEHLITIKDMQDARIKAAESQLGFMQREYQKLSDRILLPAGKPWWMFWK